MKPLKAQGSHGRPTPRRLLLHPPQNTVTGDAELKSHTVAQQKGRDGGHLPAVGYLGFHT